MTMPFEAVEAEEIPASHLLRARCTGRGGACGAPALCTPGREASARCAACWGGSVVLPRGAVAWTPVVGYRLNRTFDVIDIEVREEYPAPFATSREVMNDRVRDRVPAAVEKLAQEAAALGWDARVTYSRGCLSHRSTGAPGPVRDVFVVRLRSGEGGQWGAYACYVGTGWDSIMMWGAELPWFPAGKVTDLRAFLKLPERPAVWWEAIRERNALAAERTRLRTACNRGNHEQARWLTDGVWCWWCDICRQGWNAADAAPRKTKTGSGEGL